jgi:hypothetical protein
VQKVRCGWEEDVKGSVPRLTRVRRVLNRNRVPVTSYIFGTTGQQQCGGHDYVRSLTGDLLWFGPPWYLSSTVIFAPVILKPSIQRCPSNTEYASSLERISIRLDQSLEDCSPFGDGQALGSLRSISKARLGTLQFVGSPFLYCASAITLAPMSEFVRHSDDTCVKQLNIFDKRGYRFI